MNQPPFANHSTPFLRNSPSKTLCTQGETAQRDEIGETGNSLDTISLREHNQTQHLAQRLPGLCFNGDFGVFCFVYNEDFQSTVSTFFNLGTRFEINGWRFKQTSVQSV
jgi:hypothetical protein